MKFVIVKLSPFTSGVVFTRWSPFIGCCRRDFSPAMELWWPPESEAPGGGQPLNCVLAPAGRSGVRS